MMRVRRHLLALALAAAAAGSAPPARASVSDFISATCGTPCADSIGEESRARENWSALVAMGTTQWLGSSMGGGTVDASALLAASRVAGASELDRWLNTGEASDVATAQAMSLALQQFSGIEVTGITGNLQPTLKNNQGALDPGGYGGYDGSYAGSSQGSANALETIAQTALSAALGNGSAFMGPGGSGSSGYCSDGVQDAVLANAQKYVNGMQTIATSGDYGFSQLGGQAISSGQRSASGYFGGSCLDSMMSGTRDMLFKPPGLSGLLSQLGSMFGGGGGSGGGCGNAPSIMNQVTQSLPSGIFGKGGGGFFPYLGNTSPGDASGALATFAGGFGLSQAAGQTTMRAQPASLSTLFAR